MTQYALFKDESARAGRQPKTDRLVLEAFLEDEATKPAYRESEVSDAHALLVHWAELESSGRLAKLNETQLQGDFLRDVFGTALGYVQPVENAAVWHQEQHRKLHEQTPDAVLGRFQQESADDLKAVVELKGPKIHLDRDRSGGRTAVDQCWDYLIDAPTTCRWGIVSNIISFRLYERDSTKRAYEHFSLQGLRDINEFRRFYVLFHRRGLVEGIASERPRAERLLRQTNDRQRQVSDDLYKSYTQHRLSLIEYLHGVLKHSMDAAVEMAQRLLDRIIFIAFCEDRRLLPEETIGKAYKVQGFHAVTNPRWESFKNLFRQIDEGNPREDISKFNGGLFRVHECDKLSLPDEWTEFFKNISGYNFRDEVNLEVLGHLFERSITELERLKQSVLFEGGERAIREYAQMPQSVRRKQLGIYYTPQELTSRIVQYTVEELIVERFARLAVEFGVEAAAAARGEVPQDENYWRGCWEILRNLKIVDPACGSGAFLFQAYNVLEQRYHEVVGHLEQSGAADVAELTEQIPHLILGENLYGVDLSREAVEITQLALWIRSATRGQTLATLSRNIVHGNSLVHDTGVHAAGFDWRERFPEVFNPPPSQGGVRGGMTERGADSSAAKSGVVQSLPRPLPSREGGFDCVIGNPPWERMDLADREFFSLPAPEIAIATTGAKRQRLIEALKSSNPNLFKRYDEAVRSIDRLREYCHQSGEFPLTGKGRTNFYAVFAELAYKIVAPRGRVGLLTPSGIASDKTTKDFFAAVAESNRLIRLFDFENKKVFFPDVHASFKFCIINFGGESVVHKSADFIFFAHSMEDLEDSSRRIKLSGDDIRLLNPNTLTCPIFRNNRDAEITKDIYRRVCILVDKQRSGPTGNPWGLHFKQGLFNQTSDSHLFKEAEQLKADEFKLRYNRKLWTS
ncbi:MAG: hypothetical protein H0T51_25255 [Pirellulales bacterium]|nr:hypothetical protein [Pirellulales bacterium]